LQYAVIQNKYFGACPTSAKQDQAGVNCGAGVFKGIASAVDDTRDRKRG
jgi:hypothetical protein